MTYLQLVNYVLRRLRETQVSTVNETDYSTLIGDFVNEAKEMVEEAWNWTNLRQVKTITTASNNYDYSIAGAEGGRLILASNKTPIAWVQEEEYFMSLVPREYIYKLINMDSPQVGKPVYYSFMERDTNNDPTVWLWNIPDGVYNIDFHYIIPQADLSNDTDEPYTSSRAIRYGALALALEDRGEDGATRTNTAWNRFNAALNDAIIADSLPHQHEVDAVVV